MPADRVRHNLIFRVPGDGIVANRLNKKLFMLSHEMVGLGSREKGRRVE